MACLPWKPRASGAHPSSGALGSEYAGAAQKGHVLGREGGSSLPGGCPFQRWGVGCLKAAPSANGGARRGRACTFRSSRCPLHNRDTELGLRLVRVGGWGSPLCGEGLSIVLGSCWGLADVHGKPGI